MSNPRGNTGRILGGSHSLLRRIPRGFSKLGMLIELAGWAAPQGGVIPTCMTFPRALVLVALLLVSAFVLFYGRTLNTSSAWKSALSSTPVMAWLMSKVESDPVHTLNKKAVETLVKDYRLMLDTSNARRMSRDVFLRDHKEFDFNVPPVSNHDGDGVAVILLFSLCFEPLERT